MAHDFLVVPCSTAGEFLSALSTRSEYFRHGGSYTWVFRGQAREEWSLVPTAFRESPALAADPFGRSVKWANWTNAMQIEMEAATLRAFISEADGAGLVIPQESHELREQVLSPSKVGYAEQCAVGNVEWPPRIAWPLVALAQHYGLATRFLDWSYSSLVAAYFAAAHAVQSEGMTGRLAVWAFSAGARMAYWGLHAPFGGLPDRFPEIVVSPYSSNPNLRAQEGLHIAIAMKTVEVDAPADRFDFLPYLQIVDMHSRGFKDWALAKFTLPATEAAEVLWYLARERVTPARLFPGYAGAAKSVLERALHRAPRRE